jgi:hypothetical protein
VQQLASTLIYTPAGDPFTVDLAKLSAQKMRVAWFDPRTGVTKADAQLQNEGAHEFKPPTRGDGCDWVLLLDDFAF